MAKLEVFFDFECPYCKRGYEYLTELLEDYPQITVDWKPCESHPYPEIHPPHTYWLSQSFLYALDIGVDADKFSKIAYQAAAIERRDMEKINEITEIFKPILDPDKLAEALLSGRYAERQQELNSYAYDKNDVWFVPAFRMNGAKLDAKGGIGVSKDELSDFLKNNA